MAILGRSIVLIGLGVIALACGFDLFHAERHTNASNFRVDSNLQFHQLRQGRARYAAVAES